MTSPSPALANRSFLYGGTLGHRRPLIAEGIVYASLDELALGRAKPARTPPAEEAQESRGPDDEAKPETKRSDASRSTSHAIIRSSKHTSENNPTTPVPPKPNPRPSATSDAPHQCEKAKRPLNGAGPVHAYHHPAFDSGPNNRAASQRLAKSREKSSKRPKSKQRDEGSAATADRSPVAVRRDFAFAKNVLHYVPRTSQRYYLKSLAAKSLSLKSLGLERGELGPRRRSLSRDELRYATISTPSNFVHVASATRRSLMMPEDGTAERSLPRIDHEGRHADLRAGGGWGAPSSEAELAALAVARKIEFYNDSFLWGCLVARERAEGSKGDQSTAGEEEEGDYDDVGPLSVRATATDEPREHADSTSVDPESVPLVVAASSSDSPPLPPGGPEHHQECAYDDVGPPPAAAHEEQVYDDVMPPPRVEDREEGGAAPQPVVVPEGEELLEPDEDVYDDVGPPSDREPRRRHRDGDGPEQKDRHERINSLYAGSSVTGSVLGAYDKESEWEDLDLPLYGMQTSGKFGGADTTQPTGVCSSSKRRSGPVITAGWLSRVRRQRSRASRKSSGGSTSRTRTQRSCAAAPLDAVNGCGGYSLAVSLGAGTVLLLGPKTVDYDEPREELNLGNAETRGLVQLRCRLAEEEDGDVQETSLYVEDSSDDSNYETVETYEPDEFSSESETEDARVSLAPQQQQLTALHEAPSRPVPPPPREASLGYALGLRMKMLRHTWSITKDSLGRMRRRASGGGGGGPGDCGDSPETTVGQATTTTTAQPGAPGDARKYFSFKKHFRKSQATGLSIFYLDGAADRQEEEKEAGRERQGPVYTNGNWYQEVGLYRNMAEERSEGQEIDHYSVLAEEPLYQFYAEAAARMAFECDSDTYEEVEERTPSSATTDLARPGHRTLWCQTPQVINSGLLQSLTMEERRIQEAKFEILTSEASYLNSLRVLENEFASNGELVQEVLEPSERERLFGSVPDVLVASERFLAELETVWREDPMLGRLPELLLKHGERSAGLYVDYCSNQVNIDASLKELKAKRGYKFLEAISKIEMRPACQSLSLHSFLMLPMQRITRLPLLADAVLSKLPIEHSERRSWERVLGVLGQIVAKCNEGARIVERRNEMEALTRKLEYSAKVPPIVLRDRELIRSGMVVHLSMKSDTEYKLTFGKKFHKTPLMLMLFTDYLLVTKLKTNSNDDSYSVIDTCKRSLVALESAPEDSPFAGRHAMVLTLLENHAGRQVEYVLTGENETDKERWLDAVSPPKPSCVGETLYESWDCPQMMALYPYAPRQPDELALHPGDVINVLRKMNDGWLFGEKLLDGEQGWFPGNFTKEVASEHVRARNLRQRHRFLALSGSVLQRKAKQSYISL